MNEGLMKRIDMTSGNITKLTLAFALPLCIGNILQHLYTIVDTIIVGNFCGTTSVAAVATSSQPIEILLFLFMGIGRGISILTAQSFGEKNYEKIKQLASCAVTYIYFLGIPLTIIGIFLGPVILRLMQVPSDTIFYATKYLNIIFLSTIAQIGYNFNSGILNGMGDSLSSLIFLIISCIINIVLDLVFVLCFHMDVTGVAIATSIATFFSWIISIIYIKRKYPEIEFTFFPRKFEKKVMSEVFTIGFPLGIINSMYSFGHTIMQGLINTQGSVFIAGCSIGSKLTSLSNLALNSLSASAMTFAGQNYGAKKYARLKKGCSYLPFLAGTITIFSSILLFIFRNPVLSIFTKDTEVLKMASRHVFIVMSFTWCYAIFNSILNIASGLGDVRFTTIVNLLMLLAVRIPVAFLLKALNLGKYLMAAISISFIFGMIVSLFYYRSKKWKKISILAKNCPN